MGPRLFILYKISTYALIRNTMCPGINFRLRLEFEKSYTQFLVENSKKALENTRKELSTAPFYYECR